MARRRGSGRPRPQGTGRPRSQGKRRFQAWQGLLAAGIAAVATIAAAAITTFGTSSGSGNPSATVAGSSGIAANHAPGSTATSTAPESVAITSFTDAPHNPPPAREYSFGGTVGNWQGALGEIFVVVLRPGIAEASDVYPDWLVSPPAKILSERTWIIDDWIIKSPPADARWEAIIVRAPTNLFGGTIPVISSTSPIGTASSASPSPTVGTSSSASPTAGTSSSASSTAGVSTYQPGPVGTEMCPELATSGPKSLCVTATSKPVRIH